MKSIILTFLLISLSVVSYSQDKPKKDNQQGKMKIEELPAVVIKRVGSDFSVYLPDKNPDMDVRKMEEKFIAYDIGKDYEGNESYLVVMQSKKGSLAATYDENGKLTRVVEQYKNIRLPNEVIYSVYRNYPDWSIVNDKFLYTQEEGDINKKQYNLKIKKGKETMKLTVRPNGEILKAK
ncbi:hypothetical protein [Flavobacterium granuli]|uniref:Beta-lactamase-inhibitor-like, PepSY-like n=1 Tax=Flavobacterium granuli TaxID=280093 RepID=A0A1M5IUN6_9FLAO|nr:hypothetical protein [Flavobacterium granuli]PRZ28109.1 hypothetical protein BC624_101396 [Flavobacterium granuli]SHG31739.1 hypothetical protein SAMN05443373_101396 [Flavobacterium granuli]